MTSKLYRRFGFGAGVLMVLAGCASQPSTINHYLLNIAGAGAVTTVDNDTVFIDIKQVQLPEYLQRRSLVMQNNDATLSIATKHVWAEPLDDDFGALLANEISQQSSYSGFYRMPSHAHSTIPASKKRAVVVNVEHFMPLENGDVLLTGIWMTEENGKLSAPTPFKYTRALQDDGYAHAIGKMRKLVADLANDITANLAQAGM